MICPLQTRDRTWYVSSNTEVNIVPGRLAGAACPLAEVPELGWTTGGDVVEAMLTVNLCRSLRPFDQTRAH